MGTKLLYLLCFLGSIQTFPKKVIAMHNLSHNSVLKYHNLQLENIEENCKRCVPPSKVQLNEHNIVNFDYGILEVFKQTDTTQIN